MNSVRRTKSSVSQAGKATSSTVITPLNDQTDLFYLDEALLSTSDEDECQNLMDCNFTPQEIRNPVFRAKYVKYLEEHWEDSDVG